MKIMFTLLAVLLTNSMLAQHQQFSELLEYYNSDKYFNGAAIVATNGKIDFLGSTGIGNRQSNTMLNTKSKFRIASLTKVFTAVLVMKLVEENKIDLDSTIGKYIPDYKGEGKGKVRVHNLLTYSSGIENKLDNLGMAPYQTNISLNDFIDSYCSGNLIFEPGEKSVYGNTEYILLHKIIENVSNENFDKYLQEVILNPLELKNTQMLKSYEIISGLLSGYVFNDSLNIFNNDAPYYPELYFGSGALYSTVEDLLKFDQALFNNELLNEQSTKTLLTVNPKLGYTAYGLWGSAGWGIFKEPFYYRTGGILGSNANWIHTMNSGKTIIVFSNTNATNLYEFSEKLYLESIGEQVEIPKNDLKNSKKVSDINEIKGVWHIDLRPTPKSEPYIKDFVITDISGNEFSGEFYNTQFSNGLLNNDWDNIHFAFTTKDRNNTYYHSGYLKGDKIYGTSYSEDRKFISYWTGTRD